MITFIERFDHKTKIKWEFMRNDEIKCLGEYDGEVENGKPNGLGKWKHN